jgi:hypothetical protein
MVLTVTTKLGELTFVPSETRPGEISWRCKAPSIKPSRLPEACKSEASR